MKTSVPFFIQHPANRMMHVCGWFWACSARPLHLRLIQITSNKQRYQYLNFQHAIPKFSMRLYAHRASICLHGSWSNSRLHRAPMRVHVRSLHVPTCLAIDAQPSWVREKHCTRNIPAGRHVVFFHFAAKFMAAQAMTRKTKPDQDEVLPSARRGRDCNSRTRAHTHYLSQKPMCSFSYVSSMCSDVFRCAWIKRATPKTLISDFTIAVLTNKQMKPHLQKGKQKFKSLPW